MESGRDGRTARYGRRAVWRRVMAAGTLTVAAGGLLAGTAHADETNHCSHNGPRVGLINTGQVDDPMEDVLEHTLLFGDGYRWD